MKTRRELDGLLNDLLEDAVSPGLRESLLAQTLAAVRQTNRRRSLRRGGLGLGLVAALCLVLWVPHPRRSLAPTRPTHTFSLTSAPILATQPLAPNAVLLTQPNSGVVVATADAAVSVIQTASAPAQVEELDDQELLKLLAGKPVVLVRLAPHQAELVFANPADADGFPLRPNH